jgi:hypothetical protein
MITKNYWKEFIFSLKCCIKAELKAIRLAG